MIFDGHLWKLGDNSFYMLDHGGGFEQDYSNQFVDTLADGSELWCDYIIGPEIRQRYPQIKFQFACSRKHRILSRLDHYRMHPPKNVEKFLCSFNGTPHVSRKLLVSALKKRHWFDNETCSKNFTFPIEMLDGHVHDWVPGQERLYRKFFICPTLTDWYATTINDLSYSRFDHRDNIKNLEVPLTRTFLHLVSESMATSSYAFVTEKFLYSVVTRGLFVAYAQVGWHDHLEQYYGFKKYNRIFDYEFDKTTNPLVRLIELMSMISKFSVLSSDDWRDLYDMEKDTIEYNYHHYLSSDYLKHLEQYA